MGIMWERKHRRHLKTISIMGLLLLSLVGYSSCATYTNLAKQTAAYPTIDQFFLSHSIPRVTATVPELYYDGKSWSQKALALIESAQDYILIDVFFATVHESTLPVFEALRRKMDEGVRVYCICDGTSYFQSTQETGELVSSAIIMRKLGIPIIHYNPLSGPSFFTLSRLFDREHRKFWIVDGSLVAFGGINVDYDSLLYPEYGGNIDSMVVTRSPDIASLAVETFVETWNTFSVDRLEVKDFPVAETSPPDPLTTAWVFNQGIGDDTTVNVMFTGLFRYAQKEIWLVQSYAFLNDEHLQMIRDARERGVAVHLILSDGHVAERYAAAPLYQVAEVIAMGVDVREYQSDHGGLLHYKMVLVDDTWVMVGSANLNFRSQYLSREFSVIVEDPKTVDTVKRNLQQEILTRSRGISAAEAAGYRTLEYWFLHLLMQIGG